MSTDQKNHSIGQQSVKVKGIEKGNHKIRTPACEVILARDPKQCGGDIGAGRCGEVVEVVM